MASNKFEIFSKIFIGTLVTSGLLSMWFINYLTPIMAAKSELALLDAQIIKKQAEYQQQINEEKNHELNQNIDTINKQLNNALTLNQEIQTELKQNKEILQKEKQKYILLQAKYEKNTNQQPNYEALNIDAKSKILDLTTKIENIEKKQAEAKNDATKLEEILTFNSLNGLWKSDGSIDNKDVYLEFLPKGAIRTFAGLDGKEFIFSNQKWFFENNQIVISSIQNNKELKEIGKLVNGNIVGTQELPSGEKIKWTLRRAR